MSPTPKLLGEFGNIYFIFGSQADLTGVGTRFAKQDRHFDFSQLRFDRYFEDEIRLSLFDSLINRMLGRKPPPRESITVGHVVAVVEKGVWFDPS